MYQVIPIEGTFPARTIGKDRLSAGPLLGRVEEAQGKGRYLVALENGGRVWAQSAAALKVGDRVMVGEPKCPVTGRDGNAHEVGAGEPGRKWTALIPLAFGGEGSTAGLEIVVERREKGNKDKKPPAVYFVFTVRTDSLGEVQWSVHLNGRQAALQVYAAPGPGKSSALGELVGTAETNLARAGFNLVGPTVRLGKPFKLPGGHRLNVRG